MTWLRQESDPEPTHPVPPSAAVSAQVVPHTIPREIGENTERPKVASIGKSVHVKGELSGNEDLAIEGRVDGKIVLNGYHVTIGETGRVEAEIYAKSVMVGGLVKGNINTDEKVEVAATGTMVGDIRSPRVVLVDGSRFKGSIDMDTKSGPGSATGNPSVSHDKSPAYAGATKR